MISNCIFTWAITRVFGGNASDSLLWIDFKLYFYVSNHKVRNINPFKFVVVNWFQIVFLREQSQDLCINFWPFFGCELISNCIFTWAITRSPSLAKGCVVLWIDFKLYFYVSNHKISPFWCATPFVVNWFQIVFLREQSQELLKIQTTMKCCELISNCIFTWAITSRPVDLGNADLLWIDFKLYFYVSNHKFAQKLWNRIMLWIDFKLYFYVSNHKNLREIIRNTLVVNWFQIVFLREQSQVFSFFIYITPCCELISNCIFTWAITRKVC